MKTIFIYMTLLFSSCSPSYGATYYVSNSGSDTNAGTLAAPFQHVQKGASLANPGDIVIVRGGTYRETVIPAHSGTPGNPITFKNNGNEVVYISALDLLSSPSAMNWTLGDGKDEIYLDGVVLFPVSLPANVQDLMHPSFAMISSASCSGCGVKNQTAIMTIVDKNLNQPTGFFNGSKIEYFGGHQWISSLSVVSSYSLQADGGHLTFPLLWTNPEDAPVAGDRYVLYPSNMPPSATQYSMVNGKLSVPGWKGQSLKAKHRSLTFDLSNKSYITINGLQLSGAGLTSLNSSGLVITNVIGGYLSQFLPGASQTGWHTGTMDTGIDINGNNNTISNSSFGWSAGTGISLNGNNNVVTNCVIHDVAYSGNDSAAVVVHGDSNQITHSTLYNTGRSGIHHAGATNLKVLYNEIHHIGIITKDLGGTYTYGTDNKMTEIAYNIFHDMVDAGSCCQVGVYADNGSENMLVHHNLFYNLAQGVQLNAGLNSNGNNTPQAGGLQVYNNTAVASVKGITIQFPNPFYSTVVHDNLSTMPIDSHSGVTETNNLVNANPGFGPAYSLPASSKITQGAYKAGATPWPVGSNLPH